MSSNNGWNNLPDVVFGDIMMMVGLENIGNLNQCRQVCRSWNKMIASNKKLKNISSAERIRDLFTDEQYFPSNKDIVRAKKLGKNHNSIALITHTHIFSQIWSY